MFYMVRRLIICFLGLVLSHSITAQTPVNQVFQYMQSGTCKTWADSSKTEASLYLWIPENCRKVRGLLIICANVPEHRLVGHSAIRKVCEANDLGIIWGVPSFMNFRKSTSKDNKTLNMALEYSTTVNFLQQLLNGLAHSSGYPEISTVPWLPMGESGHLLMVDALVENSPERCMAGIWIKNNHLPPKNREVPALVIFGTSQEWGQDKEDIRTRWNNIGSEYDKVLKERQQHPNWPLSYVIDGTSGHFDCSERITKYIAGYIDQVAKARLSKDNSPELRPVALEKGYTTDLPVPGHTNCNVCLWSKASPEGKSLPWYFDKLTAQEAKSIASINWKAQSQFPGYLDAKGNILPYDFNGITNFSSLEMEEDGITFKIRGIMLDRIPANFVGAGEKLARAPGEPVAEWLCGPLEPLGKNRFRIALDRTYEKGATYIGLRQKGNDSIRGIFEPAGINFRAIQNNDGKVQTIIFENIQDVKAGTKTILLKAKSDAGLPVRFYVISGPAIIKNDRLILTKIPPGSRFPVGVTVAAWQWGRGIEPKVKTAKIIRQSFNILQK